MRDGEPQVAFLVCGHGTRQAAGVAQALEVGQQLARYLAPAPVEVGFLELAAPTIEEAVERLARRMVREFITLPILLFSAGHAERDIPEAVHEAARKYGLTSVAQSSPLDDHPAIVQLSADRFHEALKSIGIVSTGESPEPNVIPAGPVRPTAASSVPPGARTSAKAKDSIGLAMIGRGSQSPDAHRAMLRFTELRRRLTPVDWCETGFITAQKPTVPELLDRLEKSDCQVLVVQPHLFFEGELVEDLRYEVARRKRLSNRSWVISETLGVDQRLARTLAGLARQAASTRELST